MHNKKMKNHIHNIQPFKILTYFYICFRDTFSNTKTEQSWGTLWKLLNPICLLISPELTTTIDLKFIITYF